jgi:hypothetical protein
VPARELEKHGIPNQQENNRDPALSRHNQENFDFTILQQHGQRQEEANNIKPPTSDSWEAASLALAGVAKSKYNNKTNNKCNDRINSSPTTVASFGIFDRDDDDNDGGGSRGDDGSSSSEEKEERKVGWWCCLKKKIHSDLILTNPCTFSTNLL